MAVGRQPTKADIDNLAGSITSDVNRVFGQIKLFNAWLVAEPNATLVALGYVQTPDVDDLKAAFARLDALRQIYEGAAAQGPVAEDFRAFPSRLWGFGF